MIEKYVDLTSTIALSTGNDKTTVADILRWLDRNPEAAPSSPAAEDHAEIAADAETAGAEISATDLRDTLTKWIEELDELTPETDDE